MGGSFEGARFSVVWAIAILVVAVLLVAWALVRRARKRSQAARDLALALAAEPMAVTAARGVPARQVVHYARPANEDFAQEEAVEPSLWRSFRARLRHPLSDRTPSAYSSLSPRNPDGSRTKPFYFNGSGRGR